MSKFIFHYNHVSRYVQVLTDVLSASRTSNEITPNGVFVKAEPVTDIGSLDFVSSTKLRLLRDTLTILLYDIEVKRIAESSQQHSQHPTNL